MFTGHSASYPLFAQQSYPTPRESTGRIVCANCHLNIQSIELKTPKMVVPDELFEIVVSIPYDLRIKQLTAGGAKALLNVGAVLILPEGFQLAPNDRILNDSNQKSKELLMIQPYSKSKTNILLTGPVSILKHYALVFPVLAPSPNQNKALHFLTYPIYVGANCGRGQIYPNGKKSNNNTLISTLSGQILFIDKLLENGKTRITIQKINETKVPKTIPFTLTLNIKANDFIQKDEEVTFNPSTGGFGQNETDIVLQSPTRIRKIILLFFITIFTQIFLVVKKKQFEKVQAVENTF